MKSTSRSPTIRAYADNARVFLERGQGASAADNLGNIAALTERIGVITDELRGALRARAAATPNPTSLRLVIEGAVQLLRSRFAGRMETLDIALAAARSSGNGLCASAWNRC